MDLLDRLMGHDHWATMRLLEQSRDLTDAQLDQPFDIGQGTLRDTFDHMIHAVDFWTEQMAGEPLAIERVDYPTIAVLIAGHEHAHATFAALARRVRDEQHLDETFVDRFGYRQTLGGTILHVILHSAQHRGEARHILQRLGVPDLWDYDPQEWEHAAGGLES